MSHLRVSGVGLPPRTLEPNVPEPELPGPMNPRPMFPHRFDVPYPAPPQPPIDVGGRPNPLPPPGAPVVTPSIPNPMPVPPIPEPPYGPGGYLDPGYGTPLEWLRRPWVITAGTGLAALLLGLTIGVSIGRRRRLS